MASLRLSVSHAKNGFGSGSRFSTGLIKHLNTYLFKKQKKKSKKKNVTKLDVPFKLTLLIINSSYDIMSF